MKSINWRILCACLVLAACTSSIAPSTDPASTSLHSSTPHDPQDSDLIVPSNDQGTWFTVDGKPFLPISGWAQPYWNAATLKNDYGINTLYNNGLGSPETTNRDWINNLEAYEMHAFLGFHDPNHADFNFVKNSPRLLAWTLSDEPDLHYPPVPPGTIQAQYNAIKAIDPSRPVLINLTGHFYHDAIFSFGTTPEAVYQQYVDIVDGVTFDFYPIAGWHQPSRVYLPGRMTRFMLEHFLGRQKLVGTIVECCGIDVAYDSPINRPTAEEMRFQVWDSIVNGAQTIGYFTIGFVPSFSWINLPPLNQPDPIRDEMKRTNEQVTRYTYVILSSDRTAELNATITSDLGANTFNYTARKNNNNYYLFVTNSAVIREVSAGQFVAEYFPANLNFQFARQPRSVEVMDESRHLNVTGNGFTDSFTRLGFHIYRIRF